MQVDLNYINMQPHENEEIKVLLEKIESFINTTRNDNISWDHFVILFVDIKTDFELTLDRDPMHYMSEDQIINFNTSCAKYYLLEDAEKYFYGDIDLISLKPVIIKKYQRLENKSYVKFKPTDTLGDES